MSYIFTFIIPVDLSILVQYNGAGTQNNVKDWSDI